MNTIDVSTGQVKVTGGDAVLESNGIGSCVCVAAYDSVTRCGGIAHIMLPGTVSQAEENNEETRLRYAGNAIAALVENLAGIGADILRVNVFAVGGGNVLKLYNDTICQNNIDSVKKFLSDYNLKISAEFLGGTIRRRIRLDLAAGAFYCAEGDESEIRILVP
jgi:chemotaxis protein CheD